MAPLPPKQTGLSRTEVIAISLSAVWLVMVSVLFWIVPPLSSPSGEFDSLRFILILIAIFMPVGLIWVAAVAARSAKAMREETFRVQIAIDGMRQSYLSDRAGKGKEPDVEKRLNEIVAVTRKTETAVASFTTTQTQPRPVAQPALAQATDQQALALGTSAEDIAPPLPHVDLIRALNFPDSEHDKDGFVALRKALKNQTAKKLVQASQDLLTLWSQDGIYMDDLHPDLARPDIWRRFANGERGREMASLGAIHDRSSLALTAARMRGDMIFRDTAHHFLRRFDQMLVKFEKDATDADLIALSETRSARGFMLLGRISGTFD